MGVKIVRSLKRDKFAAIPNALLRDSSISDRARGLLCRMLSHADGRGPSSSKELAAGTREGRDAIRAAEAELERAGYLRRRQVRLPNGQTVTEVTVYDSAQPPDDPVSTGQPGPDSQALAPPARTDVSAAQTSDGFSGAGSDQYKRESPQVVPGTDSQALVQPAETSVPAGRTSDGFSGAYQKTKEDQLQKTKKISRAAQEREAHRWLRTNYGEGLTDFVLNFTIEHARQRAVLAGRPIQHLVPYLKAMTRPDRGGDEADLADVIKAAMDIEDARASPELRVIEGDIPTYTQRRKAIDACRLCDPNGMTRDDRPRRCDHQPAQLPLMTVVEPPDGLTPSEEYLRIRDRMYPKEAGK